MTTNLQHFGVLGMHWGQRKPGGNSGSKPRPAEVRKAIGTMAKTAGGKAANAAKGVGEAFKEKHKSRKVSEAELEVSRQYVKEYLKLAGKAVITGLVVAQAGKAIAQMYIRSREVQRFNDLFG